MPGSTPCPEITFRCVERSGWPKLRASKPSVGFLMVQFPITGLAAQLRDLGASFVLVKRLAPNDNSKNQVYVGRDISEVSLLRPGEVSLRPGASLKRGDDSGAPIYHAPLDLWWLLESCELKPARRSKLILYPQYSNAGEVRLSGFLAGCRGAPSQLFDAGLEGRSEGRVLVLAPLQDGRLLAKAFAGGSEESAALYAVDGEPYAVFERYELARDQEIDAEADLLSEIYRIHRLGWLDPVHLNADGSWRPCRGTNCGGVTLETHLGIRANGFAEPDFHGWEVKQHGVTSFERPRAGPITLFTPEPTGGCYVSEGPEHFIRTWGYADLRGREDRINFGGVHRVSEAFHPRTNLRLVLFGYDAESQNFNGDGQVALIDPKDRVAASWSFAKLMDHWKRKHANAVFVPSESRGTHVRQYRYGADVKMGEGAHFRRLLRAFYEGAVYYDPGLKVEGASTEHPELKRRSQFRVSSLDLPSLYSRFREISAQPRQPRS